MFKILPICSKIINISNKSGVKNCFQLNNRKINHQIKRYCHSKDKLPNVKHNSFEDLLTYRRNEAKRSIVVQVFSENSYPELQAYCSRFGKIKVAHHYKISNYNDDFNYVLIEFSKTSEADAAKDASCFTKDIHVIPVKSSFLYFGKGIPCTPSNSALLASIDGNHIPSVNDLNVWLQEAENLEDQIKILYNATKLNDVGTRLRFLAAQQIELSLSGMFPDAVAYPFGSSVNGFGKLGCDLDVILRLDQQDNRKNIPSSRLIFHTKEFLSDSRYQTQKSMERIGDLLELFLPGVGNVRRILKARVPIIKYKHELLDLEVDLSMSNLSGVYMSELFYLFGQMDDRVRPLTFCIRRWAQSVGLTNPSPGRWITNFSLTTLVIFFLQQLKKPILPSINNLTQKATKEDARITSDGINCTFARDLKNINFITKNTDVLGHLMLQFFEFYSQFDFQNRAISLNEAKTVVKPDYSGMYITNPLETSLNVSKNVSLEETERFRIEVRNAAWLLESAVEKSNTNTWGLLNLFHKPQNSLQMTNKRPLVDVRKLFDEETFEVEESSTTSSNIEYKNNSVKLEVEKIQKQTKVNLENIKLPSRIRRR